MIDIAISAPEPFSIYLLAAATPTKVAITATASPRQIKISLMIVITRIIVNPVVDSMPVLLFALANSIHSAVMISIVGKFPINTDGTLAAESVFNAGAI